MSLLLSFALFTECQRYQIWAFRHLKPTQIAQKIGKHRSVVTRQINQSGGSRQEYTPQKAHQAYLARRSTNATKTTQPIYEAIEQGGTLYKELRHASKPYRKRYGKPDGRIKTIRQAAKPSIDYRPSIVEEKTRFGDWELDTVIGPNHKGVLVTFTGRSTNYLLMKRVDDKSAQNTRQAIVSCLLESGLPVLTLTSDNGSEFVDYQQVAKVLRADFHFAHPYHAWERRANEHNNKLIRQYNTFHRWLR